MENITSSFNVTLDLNETTSQGPTPLPATPPPVGYYGETRQMLWKVIPPIIMVWGTIGNVLTFLVLVRQKTKLSSTAMYLMALAISDTLVLYTGPLRNWLAEVWEYDMRYRTDAGCKIQIYITYASLHCSSWLLVAVTTERALSVVFPHKVRLGCTTRTAGIVILVTFLVTYGLNVVNLVIYGNDAYHSTMKCAPTTKEYLEFRDNVFQWIDFFIAFALPFVILLTGNVVIIVYLQKSRNTRKKMSAAAGNKNSSTSGRSTKSVSVLMIALCAIFFLTMTPSSIFNLYHPTKQKKIVELFKVDPYAAWYDYQFTMFQHAIVNLVSYTNASFNFVLYVFSGSKFRKELRAMFCCDVAGKAGVFGSKTTKSSRVTGTTSLSVARTQNSQPVKTSQIYQAAENGRQDDKKSNGVAVHEIKLNEKDPHPDINHRTDKCEAEQENKLIDEKLSSISNGIDAENKYKTEEIHDEKEKDTTEDKTCFAQNKSDPVNIKESKEINGEMKNGDVGQGLTSEQNSENVFDKNI